MKAILLAAGLGTRLKPLTNYTPKCLIPVNGKPMLEYWLEIFNKYKITDVLINLNHLPELVSDFISKSNHNLKIDLVYESELLGSLGTLIKNKKFFNTEENVFIIYADTLTSVNLEQMYVSHIKSNLPLTIGLFHANNPKSCGVVNLNENNIVIDFEEKPENPNSNLANAGIYILNTHYFNNLVFESKKILDIGYDLLPRLINYMNGYVINDFIIDIGTHNNLNFANEYLSKKTLFNEL